MNRIFRFSFLLAMAIELVIFGDLSRAQDFDNVQIQTIKAGDGIFMLSGAGGNIGVCVGEDGVFLIDDQFAPLNPKIMKAISELSDKPVKFLINTHWHSDHTGGNVLIGETGAVIVAHDNVRKRLSSKQFIELFNRTVEPLPKAGLPVVTFSDSITFHFNDQEIRVFHVDSAHTDGDAVIYFKDKNVMHTGDLLFSGRYPIIDLSNGGSVNGMIQAADRLLELIDDETVLIPGHGSLGQKSDLLGFRHMLADLKEKVKKMVDSRMSLEEIQAAKPTAEYDAVHKGSIPPDGFVKILYDDITR